METVFGRKTEIIRSSQVYDLLIFNQYDFSIVSVELKVNDHLSWRIDFFQGSFIRNQWSLTFHVWSYSCCKDRKLTHLGSFIISKWMYNSCRDPIFSVIIFNMAETLTWPETGRDRIQLTSWSDRDDCVALFIKYKKPWKSYTEIVANLQASNETLNGHPVIRIIPAFYNNCTMLRNVSL